jgi:hypothetical protein
MSSQSSSRSQYVRVKRHKTTLFVTFEPDEPGECEPSASRERFANLTRSVSSLAAKCAAAFLCEAANARLVLPSSGEPLTDLSRSCADAGIANDAVLWLSLRAQAGAEFEAPDVVPYPLDGADSDDDAVAPMEA